MSSLVEVGCASCSKTVETKPRLDGRGKLPRGWKETAVGILCGPCLNRRFAIRALTIPIGGVVGRSWEDLRTAHRESFRDATRVANWAVSQLYAAEDPRLEEQEKMPPMKRLYLYPGARKLAPSLSPSSVVSLLQAVESRYRKRRYHVVWLAKESLPTYRYPSPLPIHRQSWSVRKDEEREGQWLVSFPLGAGQRFTVRLRGGRRFGRALSGVEAIAEGRAERGEMVLLEQPAGSEHRGQGERRLPGGGPRRGTRFAIKMVARFPVATERVLSGELHVRTSSGSLLVWVLPGFGTAEDPRILYYHGDHARRWSAARRRYLDRQSDDLKAEWRLPGSVRRAHVAARGPTLDLFHRRLETVAKQAAACAAGFARRQRVAAVVYNDTEKSFCPEFPWSVMRGRVQTLCHEAGIGFRDASAFADENGQEPLVNEESK